MSVQPLPPERPKARKLLDADAHQRVGQAPKPAPRERSASSRPPGEAGASAKREVRIHSKPERLKWSFGGLTISVRLLVALAVVGVLLATLVPLSLQWMRQEQAYRAVVAEVSEAEQQNQDLRDQLAEWENEDYVAAQARERLGYVRPGESQFVVTDAPQKTVEEPKEERKENGPAKPWMWQLVDQIKDIDNPPPTTSLQEEADAGKAKSGTGGNAQSGTPTQGDQ